MGKARIKLAIIWEALLSEQFSSIADIHASYSFPSSRIELQLQSSFNHITFTTYDAEYQSMIIVTNQSPKTSMPHKLPIIFFEIFLLMSRYSDTPLWVKTYKFCILFFKWSLCLLVCTVSKWRSLLRFPDWLWLHVHLSKRIYWV